MGGRWAQCPDDALSPRYLQPRLRAPLGHPLTKEGSRFSVSGIYGKGVWLRVLDLLQGHPFWSSISLVSGSQLW